MASLSAGADRLVSGKAWAAFCDRLKTIGLELTGTDYPAAALDRTDGYRHLALLLDAALRWYAGGSDPDFPRFCQMNDTPEIADNLFAPIRGDATYRITGNLGTLFDINISVHDGWGFLGQSKVWGDLGRRDLDIAEDGSFTLILSPNPHPGNWLRLEPEAAIVQIREYFNDWQADRPGEFEIVRIGSEGEAPPRQAPSDLARRLDQALDWVQGYVRAHKRILETIFPQMPNVLAMPSRHSGGNKNILYGFGRFALQPDEALVLDFEEPRARAWSVQWLTSPWYENPDIANRFTSVIGTAAHVNRDGRVRVVLAAHDPQVPNWLETAGYAEGVIVTRWIWCDNVPVPQTSVVKLDQLHRHLPPDTPRLSPEERNCARMQRRAHFARRRR